MNYNYKLKFLPLASDDTNQIKRRLLQFYPGTVGKFMDELKKQVKLVKKSPYMFVAYERNPKYRKMIVLDYIAFYTVEDDKKLIQVYRILYGMRDFETIEFE